LWSIARGAVPLALFGPHDYARTMGRLATPMLIAAAVAPLPGAYLIAEFGPRGTLLVLALGAVLATRVTVRGGERPIRIVVGLALLLMASQLLR